MKRDGIEASAETLAKAKEIQERLNELFKRVDNEKISLQEIVRDDLLKTGKWDQDQVNVIIENLQKGIETYQTQRIRVNDEEQDFTLEQLEELLANIPEEEQKDKLIAALYILSFVKDTNSDLTQLRNDWDIMGLDALKDLVVANINKDATYDNVVNLLKESIGNPELSSLNLPEKFGELSDDYKLYVAAQIFIEADNIDAQNLEGQAQAIGASSAAGVDIAYETMRWQNGEISEPAWHSIVKTILAVLAFCTISIILLYTSVDLLLNVFLLFTAIFGFNAITVFLGIILGYAFVAGVLYLLYQGFNESDGEIIEDIDAFLEKCLCKIDEWIEKIKEKVSNLLEQLKEKLSAQGSEAGQETGQETELIPVVDGNIHTEEQAINNATAVPVAG